MVVGSAADDVIDLGVAAEGHAGYVEVLRPGRRAEDAVGVPDPADVVIPWSPAVEP